MLDNNRQGKFTASQIYRLMADGIVDFEPERIGEKGIGYQPFVDGKPYTDSTFKTVADYTDWLRAEKASLSKFTLSVGALSYVEEVAMTLLFADDLEFEPDFQSIHTRRGHERELAAIAQFEVLTGLSVAKTGDNQEFIDCGSWGGTPDGIINEPARATIDVKSPMRAIHLKYMLNITNQETLKKVEPAYYWQQQAQIASADCSSGYWCSYNPCALNYAHRMHIIQVDRNQADIDLMLIKIDLAAQKLNELLTTLRERN